MAGVFKVLGFGWELPPAQISKDFSIGGHPLTYFSLRYT